MNLQTTERKITLNCRGRLIGLHTPQVMGILNSTPDSFFEGSRVTGPDAALKQAETMLKQGALFLDIGGYSSRPGATDIAEDEELRRAIPVIEAVARNFPEAVISVDTFRSKVAHEAVQAGASIVNDISAGEDDLEMLTTVAGLKVPYIMMHKQGTPQTMQKSPQYGNVVMDVLNYFTVRTAEARKAGITDLIVDPGFGFGKLPVHNYSLLSSLGDFGIIGVPVLAGLSRKKMIQLVAGTDAAGALNATSAAHTIALVNGANILRVHDVKEAMECIKIVNATYGAF